MQQVRAVYDQAKQRWELHLVCKDEIKTPNAPGEETAGIDLGICNFAAVAYSTENADLYPGNRLKQDGYYFNCYRPEFSPSWSLRRFVLLDFGDDHVPVRMVDSIPAFERAFHIDSILVGPDKECF